jgi:MFS family permease
VTPNVRAVVAARTLRGFIDGFVSVLLASYLSGLGFSPFQIGAVVTGTLIGSAVLTLGVGLLGQGRAHRTVLLAACVLMALTGLGFAAASAFWAVLLVAIVGTLNPSSGDVSVFLPTEQAFLADHVEAPARPALYARYNLAGGVAGAVGALVSAVPEQVSDLTGLSLETAQRLGFVGYALCALAIAFLYRGLPTAGDRHAAAGGRRRRPRRIVWELAALFSLDSAGSGFVVTSLLVLWLHLRFGLDTGTTAAVFFAAGLLAGLSQLLAGPLAARIGLIRTMSYTHLPANIALALAAFAPVSWLAIGLLLTRALFSQMDVPARQSFVMAVVPADERAAAASVTNVPRSLASAATPLLAGALLSATDFGWPLLIAGVSKATYDVLLLVLFRHVPEEVAVTAARSPRRRSATGSGASTRAG